MKTGAALFQPLIGMQRNRHGVAARELI